MLQNQIKLKFEQFPRQADSPESFGTDPPIIAVDPTGKWVAQAGSVNSDCEYGIEIYELVKDTVTYSQLKKISISGEKLKITGNNKIKGLRFNRDGTTLWVSLGTNPSNGPFKTWIIKFNTKNWNHEIFGPISPYEYLKYTFSKVHFLNFDTYNDNGTEKLIAPSQFNRNALLIFNPEEPNNMEFWELNLRNEENLQIYMRFTDLIIKGDLLYVSGWTEIKDNIVINNPYASLIILDLKKRKLVFGPLIIPEMLGYFNFNDKIIWPLKLRLKMNSTGAYLIAEKLVSRETGGLHPDHSGFAYIEFESKTVKIRDSYPVQTKELRLQEVRDVIELVNGNFILIFKRDLFFNSANEIIKLNEDLHLTQNKKLLPEDWWPHVQIENHPKRLLDIIISAIRNIYHPINPTGQISIWEASQLIKNSREVNPNK